ncbi:MAG: potassium channel protein [bacterium]|nr:potassium channel protein [bacterium]
MAIGTCGYIYFEGYTLVDALYMSFLALSTVGFGEVAPLSNAGKIFTIFYIVFNIATLAYAISVITLYLFEGEFRKMFRTYLIGRKVRKLKDHVIVCGYGRNGAKACEELLKSKQPFVVVENNEEILEFLPDKPKFDVINGSALDEETLLLAGIDHARAIICTWQNDSDNMVITLTAKQMNPDIQIVTKASNDRSEKKLFAAGAQSVVRPYSLGGIHLANLVTRPYVIEFLELISGVGDHQLKLEEFTFKELKKEFRNKTIQELDIRRNTGATIIGLKAPEKGFIFNPNRDMTITEGDVMIIFGTDESIDKFKIYCD